MIRSLKAQAPGPKCQRCGQRRTFDRNHPGRKDPALRWFCRFCCGLVERERRHDRYVLTFAQRQLSLF